MSKYIRYVLNNIEPIRISNDSNSQSGQTDTLTYIPGSSIRGYIINKLEKEQEEEDYVKIKRKLFSDKIRFLNAYKAVKNMDGKLQELMPSLKGVYEDKTTSAGKKKIETVVVDGKFSEGNKRASLGDFCYIEGDCIKYYSVDTDADLRIRCNVSNKEDRSVFRSEYITSNQNFVGYIAFDDDTAEEVFDGKKVADIIKDAIGDIITVGNSRTSGLGKCKVVSCEWCDEGYIPYGEYAVEGGTKNLYMVLLSDTVMRDAKTGEYCGIDVNQIEQQLGVSELKVEYCSTSINNVRGYNKKWGVRTPSVVMYEKGSVFHMSYTGELTRESIKAVMDAGVGERRNEGFGRVLIVKDYEKIEYKERGSKEVKDAVTEEVVLTEADKKVLTVVARKHYLNELNKYIQKKIANTEIDVDKSPTQWNQILAYSVAYRYNYEEGKKAIDGYINHNEDKNATQKVHKIFHNSNSYVGFVSRVLKRTTCSEFENELGIADYKPNIMGIAKDELISSDELGRIKLEYISGVIRHNNKN